MSGLLNSSGDGKAITDIDRYQAVAIKTWNIIRVGCQAGGLAWWRENWRRIAEENEVDEEEAAAAFAKVEAWAKEN